MSNIVRFLISRAFHARKELADKRLACLAVVHDLEVNLRRVQSIIESCPEGPAKNFLKRQQAIIEATIQEARELTLAIQVGMQGSPAKDEIVPAALSA